MVLLCIEFLTSHITVVLLCIQFLTSHVTVVKLHVHFVTLHFTVVMLYVQLITSYLIVSILCTFPNFTSDIFIISVYITNFTCAQIFTHQTLINLLHVLAWHGCHHLGILSVANALNPSAWGHLKPSSYCGVGRFSTRYLNLELNCAGVYSK